jgi:hypothetical protein
MTYLSIEEFKTKTQLSLIEVDEYKALISKKQLDSCKLKINREKQLKLAAYVRQLSEFWILPSGFNNWRLNVFLKNRDHVLNRIFEEGLFASAHYKMIEHEPNDYPVCDFIQSYIINLFLCSRITLHQVEKIATLIRKEGEPIHDIHSNSRI